MTSNRPATKSAPGAVAAAAEGMDNTKTQVDQGASVSILADPTQAVEATHTRTAHPRGRTEDGRPGWAASCSCGAITFGGFTTAGAAKAALDAECARTGHTTTRVHPAWCDPEQCSPFDDDGLVHAREYTYADGPVQARAQLGQWVSLTGPGNAETPGVILEVNTPDEPLTPAQVIGLAAWLTNTAADVTAALGTGVSR